MSRFKCPSCAAPIAIDSDYCHSHIFCQKCGRKLLAPPPVRSQTPLQPSSKYQQFSFAIPAKSPVKTIAYSVLGFVGMAVLVLIIVAIPKMRYEQSMKQLQRESQVVHNNKSTTSAEVGIDPIMGSLCLCGLPIALVFGYIATLVWVVRDCRNRSVDNGIMWMILIALSFIFGLMIYLASRPSGSLVICEKCGNKRLPYVRFCPHCRNQVGAGHPAFPSQVF